MTEGNFTDWVKIQIKSGNGGKGSTHLRREKYVPRGGPDGGDGGRGGHIFVEGNKDYWTLFHFKFNKHFKADHGGDGSKSRSTGANGKDIHIQVPLGTIVKEGEIEKPIIEITEEGQLALVAKGGKGGRGNWHFRSSTNQTPRYAQGGILGEEKVLSLELKVLADVGLVGLPNAGKSTLLSVITSAKPKIANYEFTTLKPNLGIVKYRDFKSFVMADIPGIIEGASQGKGLGYRFLRHIERSAILLFLIAADSEDIVEVYNALILELKKYNPELLDKKRILAVSKSDLLDEELEHALQKDIESKLPNNLPCIFISSVSQKRIDPLKDLIWNALK